MGRRGAFRILDERTVSRASGASGALTESSDAPDNPYWLDEEPDPHPAPEKGCVRRGICCRTSPGWFGPGEADRAAATLGLEPDAFVRQFLVIDEAEVDGERVPVFVPVKLDRFGQPALPPASRVDDLYRFLRGPCVFFDGSGCRIYAARPIECERYVCTNAPEQNLSHEAIGRLWRAKDADPAS